MRMCRRFLLVLLCLVPSLTAAKPNVVLITVSSVGKLSPSIAPESMSFERAYAQSPDTVSSTATILTGTYPQTHHVEQLGGALAPAVPFLPDLLRLRGYRAAAFVGTTQLDPKAGSVPGVSRGFATYDAGFRQRTRGQDRFASTERRANEVVTRAVNWITQNAKFPFFVWVQLNDASSATGSAYIAATAAVNAAITKMIVSLRAQKLYEDALIVIAADHGQSLGAHGEEAHGIFLYDETIRVPLFLKLPQKRNAGKKVQARVGLIDLAPTILEIAQVPVPSQMQGQSLLRTAAGNADRPVYSRSDVPDRGFGWSILESWRAGKYLYIRAPKPELYDLTADPGAKKNLATSSKATLDTMGSQLTAFTARFSGDKSASTELSSSEMQKLASLGYVGLQKSTASTAEVKGTDPKDQIDVANKTFAGLRALSEGNPDRALAVLQPVQPLSNIYLAQYAMGAALAQQQKFAAAIEHLHKAIELQPDSAWAHYQMGLCTLQTSDFKTAAVHLEIATSRLPDFAEAHALLAQVYDRLGRAEDAKRERAKAPSTTK
jgi:arylsulfatase A-like enzyme/Flp pilus assembly protein TadD